MFQKLKSKKDRGQRHSAAWGKRLSMLLLLLIAETAFAQRANTAREVVSKFAPDLAAVAPRAHHHASATQTVKVIVQYRESPERDEVGRMQRMGARVGKRLGLVKGFALTVPMSSLAALEANPRILSVSIDHPLKGLDDITDNATNVSAARNAGYDGTGVTVAVIDSGINDSHPDLQDSTQSQSRVLYHQDFTGTATTNAGGATYDLYGHGTHVAGIIGGNGYLSGGNYSGVAPGVTFVDLRALDANGAGSDSTVI